MDVAREVVPGEIQLRVSRESETWRHRCTIEIGGQNRCPHRRLPALGNRCLGVGEGWGQPEETAEDRS